MAQNRLGSQRGDLDVTATLLVHDAWERLVPTERRSYNDRKHFFATAARALRQVLVDLARKQAAIKRGGGTPHISLTEGIPQSIEIGPRLLDLDAAISRLSDDHPRLGPLIELKLFAGLETVDIAEALDVSERTVKRDWRYARAVLLSELDPNMQPPA